MQEPLGEYAGADPGFFLGGGALVSCSTTTPINHIVFLFFLQNTSCIRKPQIVSVGGGGGGGAQPLHLSPRSAPGMYTNRKIKRRVRHFTVYHMKFRLTNS